MMATPQQHPAYAAIARYCSYQDRTEKEVREKLLTLGVEHKAVLEQLIGELKAERFLDEERYVASFIRGRLLGKHWGKRKIRLALTSKGVDSALVDRALATIDDGDYLEMLHKVAIRKMQSFIKDTSRQNRQRLVNYLLQKGYEPELVYQVVQELM